MVTGETPEEQDSTETPATETTAPETVVANIESAYDQTDGSFH